MAEGIAIVGADGCSVTVEVCSVDGAGELWMADDDDWASAGNAAEKTRPQNTRPVTTISRQAPPSQPETTPRELDTASRSLCRGLPLNIITFVVTVIAGIVGAIPVVIVIVMVAHF